MKCKIVAILFAITWVYVFIGGAIFMVLEQAAEEKAIEETHEAKLAFIETAKANAKSARVQECISRDDLNRLIETAISAYERGIKMNDNSTDETNWDYFSSTFFATTVITTIGYGHISPATAGGRIFCIIYALFGIPLCLITLGGLGQKIKYVAQLLDSKMDKCNSKSKLAKVSRALLLGVLGLALFMLIPSAIFMALEGWTYSSAIYYSFITLSTIGFGDYVAGQASYDPRYRGLYRVCVALWIYIGLAWLAGLLSLGQDSMQSMVNKINDKVKQRDQRKGSSKSLDISISKDKMDATMESDLTNNN